MSFLTYVTKVLQKVNRNESLRDQLNFVFTNLPGCSIKSAYELEDFEVTAYSTFFELLPKEKKKVKSITFTRKRL